MCESFCMREKEKEFVGVGACAYACAYGVGILTQRSLRRRYAGSKVRILNEQFIELFDTDLVTVDNVRKPQWL